MNTSEISKMVTVNSSKDTGLQQNPYPVVPSILKHSYLSTVPYSISYRSVHLLHHPRHPKLIWLYRTYSSGIAWTTGSAASRSSSSILWTLRYKLVIFRLNMVERTWLATVASLFGGGTGVMRDYYEGTPLVVCQNSSLRPTDAAVLFLTILGHRLRLLVPWQ